MNFHSTIELAEISHPNIFITKLKYFLYEKTKLIVYFGVKRIQSIVKKTPIQFPVRLSSHVK